MGRRKQAEVVPLPLPQCQPEVIEGMSFAEYAASPEAHATALRHMLISPLAYRDHEDHGSADSDAMRLGRAVHTACLEPFEFMRRYALWTGGRRAGKEWEAFCLANSDKTILKDDQYNEAVAVQKSVRAHSVAGKYLSESGGRPELTIRWTHERTKVRIKCRIDWLCSAVVDLKSCRDPSPAKFSSAAATLGYAMQMALYRDAVAAAGLGVRPGKFIAVQSSPPYDVVVYDVDSELHALGVSQYERALDLLVECTSKKSWPGMAPSEEVTLRLPAWATPEDESEPIMFGDQAI